ncbi:hypothetical protein D3C85_1570800 [compost metagenome]
MRTTLGAETITVLRELLLIDRREYLRYGLLDDSVYDCRNSQISYLSVLLWYFYPSNGTRTVFSVQNRLLDNLSVFPKIL